MAIPFANEIEDTMFWCYLATSAKTWEEAADTFYAKVNFSRKQDVTNKAVTEWVDAESTERWRGLNRRVQELLGEGNSIRNLIGHNPVSINLYVPAGQSLDDHRTTVVVKQEVSQKRAMVERGKRPTRIVGDSELAVYCEDLFNLYLDLEKFAEEALQFGSTHPLRFGHPVSLTRIKA